MARPRKQITLPTLTQGQMQFVLERAVAERRLSLADIGRYQRELAGEIRDVEQRLASLRAATQTVVRLPVRAAEAQRSTAAPAKKRRRASSPEVTAQRKIGGRYMGLMRSLPQSKRKGFAKIKAEKGFEAAIAAIEASRK